MPHTLRLSKLKPHRLKLSKLGWAKALWYWRVGGKVKLYTPLLSRKN